MLITNLGTNPIFQVFLQIDDDTQLTCLNKIDCQVLYSNDFTPILNTIEPSHFYIGQTLTVRLKPKLQTYDKFAGIKLGMFNCAYRNLENYKSNSTDMIINCDSGDNIVEKITNFTVNFASGFSIISSFLLKQDVDPNLANFSSYYLKVFPRVDEINYSKGSPYGGQVMLIKGAGFIENKTIVMIGKDECIVQNIKYDLIECITNRLTNKAISNDLFIGSKGLRRKIFNNSYISNKLCLPTFPNISALPIKDDILLETSTAPTGKSNYSQLLYGYFKAVYSGNYRFWISCNDACIIKLSNDTNSSNNNLIIEKNTSTPYDNPFSQFNLTTSNWIYLTAGNFYNLEILHSHCEGEDYLKLGVEINQSSIKSNMNPLPNQMTRILSVILAPNISSRDTYKFAFPLNNSIFFNNYINGSLKNLSINPNWTAIDFRTNISFFTGESNLIVRKVGLNDIGEYFLASGESFDDSSYSTTYNFSSIFIYNGSNSIKTVSSGNKIGVIFFVIINRRSSEIINKWTTHYFLTSNSNSIKPLISLIQSVSQEITGSFKIKVKNTLLNYEYITQDIDIANFNNLQNQFENIPILTGKVQIYNNELADKDTINFYIRFGIYDQLIFNIIPNPSLIGGNDNNVVITINDLFPSSQTNLFFFPIPSDFLYLKNNSTQIVISVQGTEAVCKNCSYTYEDPSNIPTVNSSSYNNSTNLISLIVDKEFVNKTIKPFIKLGNNIILKENVSYNADTKTFYGNLSSILIGGSYSAILSSELGDCSNTKTEFNIVFPIVITEILPSFVLPLEGVTISIYGKNFPKSFDSGFIIIAGGSNCSVKTLNSNLATCITGKNFSVTDGVNVSYNRLNIFANGFKFLNVTYINIVSVYPKSVAPGDKNIIKIKFDRDVLSYNITGMSAKFINSKAVDYQIKMNVISILNDTIEVKYEGADMANYDLIVQLNQSTFSKLENIFNVSFSIDSITPNVGSINGGTLITLTGKNFLSSQINQIIYIGKTPCIYLNSNNSNIVCTTALPNKMTTINNYITVSIKQMNKYISLCNVPAPIGLNINDGCYFNYSSDKTAVIYNVASQNNEYTFKLNDVININGSNIVYSSSPNLLIFEWGNITVTSYNNSTSIIGTVSGIIKYGLFNFDFRNDYGIATHLPSGNALGLNRVQIFLKKPQLLITSISPTYIGEFGSIFKFFTNATDFYSNLNNKITICDFNCILLKSNLLNDSSNNFQCLQKYYSPVINFTNCDIKVSYYGYNFNLSVIPKISSLKANNYLISDIFVDGYSIFSNDFYYFGIKNPQNFVLEVLMKSPWFDPQNVQLIVDNRYVFTATSVINRISYNSYIFYLSNGLPAGSFPCLIYVNSVGFVIPIYSLIENGVPTSAFRLNINIKMSYPSRYTIISSSYNGGVTYNLNGFNLNKMISNIGTDVNQLNNSQFQRVFICGIEAKIINYTSTNISFITPTLLKYDFYRNKTIMNKTYDIVSKYSDIIQFIIEYPNAQTNLKNLIDNDIYTSISLNKNSIIAIRLINDFPKFYRINLLKVMIHISETSLPSDFDNGYIEGSLDNISWTNLANFPKSLTFNWNTIKINSNQLFGYIRIVAKANSSISEIRFLGNIVMIYNTNSTIDCYVQIIDNFNYYIMPNLIVSYDPAKTVMLDTIKPNTMKSIGGEIVKVNLSLYVMGNETLFVNVFGISTQATFDNYTSAFFKYNSLSFIMPPRDNDKMDFTKSLTIIIGNSGYVYTDDFKLRYQDNWSDNSTWVDGFLPTNGESIFIKNFDIILDVPNVDLNILTIENGSLIVKDGLDYKLDANIIFIKNGSFIVGTESTPFKNNFILTMKSKKGDTRIPFFGNNVLALLDSNLSLYGMIRIPTWTLLSKTSALGDTSITVVGPVDWKTGDEIVISSSSTNYKEAEKRKIISVDNTIPNAPVIQLSDKLLFVHYGQIETYGTSDVIDMRSEVVLLTRNIVVQGSLENESQQYGSIITLSTMSMNMNSMTSQTFFGKIANIEIRRAGQAFELGKYPIHFHMIGDVLGSFIKGCSIHDTYNRGLTIHGVSNFLVDSNVAYNVMGHTYFIEDGVETNNTITNNVGMMTNSAYTLLNSDINPATFLITNPNNYFEGNRACGSSFYGILLDMPITSTGKCIGINTCPRDYNIISFKDNFSHSNGKYGMRIFSEYAPKSQLCGVVNYFDILNVQAIFNSTTLYKNAEKGIVVDKIGSLLFSNFKIADNPQSSFEVIDLINLNVGEAKVQNSVIIGKSRNNASDLQLYKTYGIVTPRKDNFTVSNIRFYSFGMANNYLFSSFSANESGSSSMDDGARTSYFEQIFSDGTETMKVKWNIPRTAIFRDMDGSLTGISGPRWVTPYYPHLLVPECNRNPKWDDGVICNDSVQVRRVFVSDASPNSNLFSQALKIFQVNHTLENLNLTNNFYNFSEIKFNEYKDQNNGWAVPFITGYNYLLTFGILGLDFSSISLEMSKCWNINDNSINLLFNYTERRQDFKVFGYTSTGLKTIANNETNISYFYDLSQNSKLSYGAFYDNILNQSLYLRISPNNNYNFNNSKLTVLAVKCLNNDCGPTSPTILQNENYLRKWSNPADWPTGQVPQDDQNVEIIAGWKMMLDITTANLNNLTINGLLFFDSSQNNLELKAKIIFIYQGRLQLGTYDQPFLRNAKITLLGNMFTSNIILDNKIELTNKILLNINQISIIGEDRSPYKSKLQATVMKNSSKIIVDKNLNWRTGDEIVISTTTFDNNQTERAFINKYINTTGEITLNSSLNFSHYGSPKATIIKDNPTNPLINLDERADVYMITRNIQIRGSDEGWGCNIFTTNYKTLNYLYIGKTNISHSEITNCGQIGTNYSALQFMNHNSIYSQSFIEGISLHDNPHIGISIVESTGVSIRNIIEFQQKGYGLYTINSNNLVLNEINVVQMKNKYNSNDTNACFYICPEQIGCSNVILSNSTCAGSDQFGFIMNGMNCDVDLTSNFNYNFAYASLYAFLIMNPNNMSCFKSGNAIAYNNYGLGYGSYPFANETYHENIISSNNLNGIVLLSATSEPNSKKVLNRALIIGQNIENPNCLTQENCLMSTNNNITKPNLCQQIGFIMSVTSTNSGLNIPFTVQMFPINDVRKDAQFGSFFQGSNITIANFEDQCNISQTVFHSNEFESDFTSIHNFKNLTLSRVLQENLLLFTNASKTWIGTPCGNFSCTGPNNIIFKITNFKNSLESFNNSEINPNPKWNNTIKHYSYPNLNISQDESLIKLNDGITLMPKFFQPISNCQSSELWNSISCSNNTIWGILTVESLDPESNSSSITSMNINMNDTYSFSNVINSFMNHDSENGNPSKSRTLRFPALVKLNSTYNIIFNKLIPKNLKLQLTYADWDIKNPSNKTYDGIKIIIQFSTPKTILVYNGNSGGEIISKEWQYGEIIQNDYCGINKWTPVQNIFEIYITNKENCLILLNIVDSIQMTLKFNTTIEEYNLKNQSTQIISNFASLLDIPSNQIRITNVIKGSTIVLTHILQINPNSTSSQYKPLDLNKAINVITNDIKFGGVNFTFPIIEISYYIVSESSTNINNQTFSINITDSSKFPQNLTFPVNNTLLSKGESSPMPIYIIIILVVICLVIFPTLFYFAYRYFQKNKIIPGFREVDEIQLPRQIELNIPAQLTSENNPVINNEIIINQPEEIHNFNRM